MIRSTTIGTLKTYRSNLNSSFTRLNQSRDTVLSQRVFNSFAEDPAAAARAFQLRRSRMSVESQHNVADATYRKYQSAWSALGTVVADVDNETKNSVKEAALRALNDPTGDARRSLGKELNELADTLVQTMNNKYGENFIFAGADGANVPFTWSEDGKLCYRGIPVDSAVPEIAKQSTGSTPIFVNANGVYDPAGTNYLKGKTSIVTADDLDTNPPVLKADGKRIRVNATTGEIDPTGTTGDYIDTTKTKTVDMDDPIVSTPGAILLKDDKGDPVKVNSAGEIDPNGDKYLVLDDGTGTNTAILSGEPPITTDILRDGNGDPVIFDANGDIDSSGTAGYYMVTTGTEPITQQEYDTQVENAAKLDYLAKESYYVDIGLGFQENEDNELIKSSGFNAALHGINFLGYGMDDEGDPQNIVTLVKRMAEICVSGNGNLTDAEYNELNRLTGKMEDAASSLHTMHDDLDAATNKLKNNMDLLEDNFYTLQEQYSEEEDVDMADSITSFIWAQYCYNAALKVGNSILSQSLMDYIQ